MFKGTILENIDNKVIQDKIAKVRETCMISDEIKNVVGHHLIPHSLGGTNDWNNAIYLTPNDHVSIHNGEFNEKVLPCAETWIFRQLGLEFETELITVDVINTRGLGAGKRMHYFVEVPKKEYHVPLKIMNRQEKLDITNLTDLELFNRALRDRDKAIAKKNKSNRTCV